VGETKCPDFGELNARGENTKTGYNG